MTKKRKTFKDDLSVHVFVSNDRATSVKQLVDQFDRIERMLKWLIIERRMDDWRENLNFKINREHRPEILDELFQLDKQKPDITDILKEKT